MKRLPIGIQTFNEIIENDYIYIDKTQHIYNLITSIKYGFLSRPRRFGKSLLLDTMAEVFHGNKELFKGLWIHDSDYVFEKYPVIRIDMSSITNDTPETFKESLMSHFNWVARNEDLDINEKNPGDIFARIITELYKKHNKHVVVLIDEYDKPILDHLTNIKTSDDNRQVLRGLYGILKSMDPYLKYVFITGVTKFTKTSIFSGLNNLKDITMLKEYANICGIPCNCLDKYFDEHISSLLSEKWAKQCENINDLILSWYDGYSWDGETKLLNPFGLLNFFFDKKFGSYWYATGSPQFLIEMIKAKPEIFTELSNLRIDENMLDTFDIQKMDVGSLLFQTGYLTVKEVISKFDTTVYVLDIPNKEVREAFNRQIIAGLTESGDVAAGQAHIKIREALEVGELNIMLTVLRQLFASIPYNLHVPLEAYYHSIFYAVMSVLGFKMLAEVAMSTGEIDAVLELSDKVYVMEFKYCSFDKDSSSEDKQTLFEKLLTNGMNQVEEKGYHKKYIGGDKIVYKVAFAFLGRSDIEMKFEIV